MILTFANKKTSNKSQSTAAQEHQIRLWTVWTGLQLNNIYTGYTSLIIYKWHTPSAVYPWLQLVVLERSQKTTCHTLYVAWLNTSLRLILHIWYCIDCLGVTATSICLVIFTLTQQHYDEAAESLIHSQLRLCRTVTSTGHSLLITGCALKEKVGEQKSNSDSK